MYDLSFRDYLKQTKRNVLEAFKNQEYSFNDLVKKLGVINDPSRNPVFDTLFIYQAIDYADFKIQDLKIESLEIDKTSAKFDLKLSCEEVEDYLKFYFEYRTSLFKESSVEQFIKYFRYIITSVIDNSHIKLSDISFITEMDYEMIYSDLTDDLNDEL